MRSRGTDKILFFFFPTCEDRENHSKIQTSFPSLGINPSATRRAHQLPDCWEAVAAAAAVAYSVEHTACPDKPTTKTDDHVPSVCYQTHTDKNKKKKGSADSKWLFTWPLCCEPVKQPPVWVHTSSTLTFFIQTTSLPLPGKCTLPFSARSVGTTRAWSVFIPRSIDEKPAGGFPGAIEDMEVWTFQLEFHSTHCHSYNRLQAQNIFSFNISYLICHNIWQWIQLTFLLQQHELLAHHLQQLYFSRLTTGLWSVIVLNVNINRLLTVSSEI